MKYAYTVAEMINSFDPRELEGEELDQFYYDKTMEARTGDPDDSPILDLFDACTTPCENSAYLLVGHRGCGKSTELNKMAENLAKDGYKVRTIKCASEMNINNPLCADILMLMGNELLKIANEIHCMIDDQTLVTIGSFWSDKVIELEKEKESQIQMGMHASIESPSLLSKILSFGDSISMGIKYGEQRIEKSRQKIYQRVGEWTSAVNMVAYYIADALDGKQPILIFEDLDKLQGETSDKIFFNLQTPNLARFNFPVIYTFPIALRYDTKYRTLDSYFRQKFFFPMIKLETPKDKEHREYQEYRQGYETIRAIVEKRADLELFDGNEFFFEESGDAHKEDSEKSVLKKMIQKTGGSLRDLFSVIRMAAQLTRRRGRNTINMADAERSIQKLRVELERIIEVKDYAFLVDICNGNRKIIEEKEMLLDLMQGGIVMEYNGEGWHNVHPLIRDFLASQGYLD